MEEIENISTEELISKLDDVSQIIEELSARVKIAEDDNEDLRAVIEDLMVGR